jgi:DNA polymerase-1
MRECFVPEKRYKIVGGDYSGCELRIIAEFSKDPVWVNAFKEGKDLHSELCAMTFNIDINDVKTPTPFKPDIKYRDVQKTLNFGLAYGMSHIKLANTIEISEDEAKDIIDKFFRSVPRVEKFLTALGNKGKNTGKIKSPPPYGRIRYFSDYQTADNARKGAIERASKNHPIQGGNADMTKLALIYIYDYIRRHDLPVRLIHTVHDEIQTEVTEEYAAEWAVKMSELMNEAAAVILKNVPMVVDCAVNDYWSK